MYEQSAKWARSHLKCLKSDNHLCTIPTQMKRSNFALSNLIVWLWRCNLSNSVAFQPDVYLASSKTSGKATRVKLQIFVVQLRPLFQRQEYKSFPKLSDFLGPEAERLHATSPEVRRCSTKSHLDDTMATFLWMVQISWICMLALFFKSVFKEKREIWMFSWNQ